MNVDCGPKLRSDVASDIKFKAKSGLLDYADDMEITYTFTTSD